jgi:hypothetical protein
MKPIWADVDAKIPLAQLIGRPEAEGGHDPPAAVTSSKRLRKSTWEASHAKMGRVHLA